MKPLVTVAVLVGLGAPAAAAAPKPPKIPAALDGVELRDGLVTVSVDKTPKRLGGVDVIVFRQTYRYKLAAEDAEAKGTATDLGIVDAASKDYLALVRIADRTPTGEVRYAPSWKDLNRDRDPELVLTRRKATGDHAFVAKKRLLQVRHGRLVETTAELAACKKSDDDRGRFGDDGPDPAVVLERFVAAPTLCGYGEALVAARLEVPEQPVPAKQATIAVSMPAADCPARAWAERHGRALPRRATVAFLTAEGRLALASVDAAAGAVEPGTVDYEGLRKVEARTVEQHLYLLLEQKTRATIFDPVLLKVVLEGEPADVREVWAAQVAAW
jgi:hypothetical protein